MEKTQINNDEENEMVNKENNSVCKHAAHPTGVRLRELIKKIGLDVYKHDQEMTREQLKITEEIDSLLKSTNLMQFNIKKNQLMPILSTKVIDGSIIVLCPDDSTVTVETQLSLPSTSGYDLITLGNNEAWVFYSDVDKLIDFVCEHGCKTTGLPTSLNDVIKSLNHAHYTISEMNKRIAALEAGRPYNFHPQAQFGMYQQPMPGNNPGNIFPQQQMQPQHNPGPRLW